jgi:hypothetical protein
MEAVNKWHLGAERSQGRIEETNPFTPREQDESQSVTRVNESNHDNTNDSSFKQLNKPSWTRKVVLQSTHYVC